LGAASTVEVHSVEAGIADLDPNASEGFNYFDFRFFLFFAGIDGHGHAHDIFAPSGG
jgi:hypothetical protein